MLFRNGNSLQGKWKCQKEILREYIESEKYEVAKETAIQCLKEGLSVEQTARCVPALSIDEVRKLQEELLQTV